MRLQTATSTVTSGDAIGNVLFTKQLWDRPSRAPDYAAEGRAAAAVMSHLAGSPEMVLQRVADSALELCEAHSAGVTLLVHTSVGAVFERSAVAGAWASHIHGSAPRAFSPYGVVVDSNAPQLFQHPERYYHYLEETRPAVVEALLVPFATDHLTNAVVWVVQHDDERTFDAEDVRRLTSLARCASTVHQVAASVRDLVEGAGAAERLGAGLLELNSVLTSLPTPALRRQPQTVTRLGLSRREHEVVRLVARGLTNQAIATMLGVSVKTVETYRARATDKLGFRNRADFVTYATSQGWLKSGGAQV